MAQPTEIEQEVLTEDQLDEMVAKALSQAVIRVGSFPDLSGLKHLMPDVRRADLVIFANLENDLPTMGVGYVPSLDADVFMLDLEGFRNMVVSQDDPEILLMLLVQADQRIHQTAGSDAIAACAKLGLTQKGADGILAALAGKDTRDAVLISGYQLARYLESGSAEVPFGMSATIFFTRLLNKLTDDEEVASFAERISEIVRAKRDQLPDEVDWRTLDATLERLASDLEEAHATR